MITGGYMLTGQSLSAPHTVARTTPDIETATAKDVRKPTHPHTPTTAKHQLEH